MQIGLGKHKISIDFGLTRSKVKVTLFLFVKKLNMVSAQYLKKYLYNAFIFNMLIVLGEDMTCIDVVFTRTKVNVTSVFVKQWFLLIILRTFNHRAIIFHMLIGLGEVMSPFDFAFTR